MVLKLLIKNTLQQWTSPLRTCKRKKEVKVVQFGKFLRHPFVVFLLWGPLDHHHGSAYIWPITNMHQIWSIICILVEAWETIIPVAVR